MSIGDGEYIVISTCNQLPYHHDRVKETLSELKQLGVSFGEGAFLELSPKEASFSVVWNGVGAKQFKTLDWSRIDELFLSDVEFVWRDIPFRLAVQFLDESSYEVLIVCSYETVSAQPSNNGFRLVEHLALSTFGNLHPVFGCIGVERHADGLECVRRGECSLPVDKAFYSADVLQRAPEVETSLRKHSSFRSNIDGVGCYFRLTDIAEYRLIEPPTLQEQVGRLRAYVV